MLKRVLALAGPLTALGRFEEAIALVKDLLEDSGISAAMGSELQVRVSLAYPATLRAAGKFDEAYEFQLPLWRSIEEKEGWKALDCQLAESYALTLKTTLRVELALDVEVRLIDQLTQLFGSNDPRTIRARATNCPTLADFGEVEKARTLAKDTMRAAADHLGRDHEATIYAEMAYAGVLVGTGDPRNGHDVASEALVMANEVLGTSHRTTSMLLAIADYEE